MSEVVDEDDRTYRVRRQRRSTIVIAVVLLSLAGRVLLRLDVLPRHDPDAGAVHDGGARRAPAAGRRQPQRLQLDDAQGAGRGGRQGRDDRGFKVKAVGNDPKDADVKQVAQIRFGPEGAASARLVKATCRRPSTSTTSARATPSTSSWARPGRASARCRSSRRPPRRCASARRSPSSRDTSVSMPSGAVCAGRHTPHRVSGQLTAVAAWTNSFVYVLARSIVLPLTFGLDVAAPPARSAGHPRA